MKARLEDSALGKAAGKLSFEPHRLRLDHTGRYEEALDREFPFLIKLFRLRHNNFTPVQSWHERLELFMPLDGVVCMVMGERRVDLAAGELLVVENMKMHRLMDAPGLDTRVIVMSFLPNFVYSLGSPFLDYFDRRFKKAFQRTPRDLRRRAPARAKTSKNGRSGNFD
jgi:hypothetical protein